MPVADLPHSGDAFHSQVMSIIGGCSDLLDEESDTRLCSDIGAPASRSTTITRQLAPPSERREQRGDSVVATEVVNTLPDEFRPPVPGSLRELGTVQSKDYIKRLIEAAPGIQTKQTEFHATLDGRWKRNVSKIEALPET